MIREESQVECKNDQSRFQSKTHHIPTVLAAKPGSSLLGYRKDDKDKRRCASLQIRG